MLELLTQAFTRGALSKHLAGGEGKEAIRRDRLRQAERPGPRDRAKRRGREVGAGRDQAAAGSARLRGGKG
jgi:hypothetical protein